MENMSTNCLKMRQKQGGCQVLRNFKGSHKLLDNGHGFFSLLSFDLLCGIWLTFALAPIEYLRHYSFCNYVARENAKHCFSSDKIV